MEELILRPPAPVSPVSSVVPIRRLPVEVRVAAVASETEPVGVVLNTSRPGILDAAAVPSTSATIWAALRDATPSDAMKSKLPIVSPDDTRPCAAMVAPRDFRRVSEGPAASAENRQMLCAAVPSTPWISILSPCNTPPVPMMTRLAWSIRIDCTAPPL